MKMKHLFLLLIGILNIPFIPHIKAQTYSDYPSELRRTERYGVWAPDTGGVYTRVQRFNQYDGASIPAYTGRTNRGNEFKLDESFWYSSKMSYQWNFSSIGNPYASVVSVRIELWFISKTDKQNTTDINIKIKPLTNDHWNDSPTDRWMAIKKASAYQSLVLPVPENTFATWPPIEFSGNDQICKDVEYALKAGTKFCIALMSEDDEDWESGTGSFRYIEPKQSSTIYGIRLTVNYKLPVSVTVQNSFGGGKLKVDSDTVASGRSFSWYTNETHTIKAFSQYESNGKYYPIKTTGVWQKNAIPFSDANPLVLNPILESATYTACFDLPSIPVVVTQELSNGLFTSAGIGHWTSGPNFNNWNVPKQFMFQEQSIQCLRGYQEIESGEKYNIWVKNLTAEQNIENHHAFSITATTNKLTSQFKSTTQGSSIKVDLLEAPGNYTGTVEFKDPWLIDSLDASKNNNKLNRGMNALFKSRPVPFSPNIGTNYTGDVYKGVFLNQDYNIPGTSYYTVRAPQTQTNFNGFEGYFQCWTASGAALADSTSNTTGVTFNSANATVTALYKMHLGSSTIQATSGTNTGRKFARSVGLNGSGTGITHAVYCSMGSIWYIHDNGYGADWSHEIKIGNGKNPSIAATETDGISYVHIVWEEEIAGNKRRVHYSRSTDGGAIFTEVTGFIGLEAAGYDATPVVFGNSYAFVVWRYGQQGAGGFYAWVEPARYPTALKKSISADWNSQMPSGAEAYTSSEGFPKYYHLAYSNGSTIQYLYLNVYSDIIISSSAQLSANPSPVSGNTNPTISRDLFGLSVSAAWQNTTNNKIYYRESTDGGSSWGTTYEIAHANHQLSMPSVSYNANSINLFFQCGSHIGRVFKPIFSGSLSSVVNYGNGYGPTLPSNGSNDEEDIYVWTKGDAAPYVVNISASHTLVTSPASGTWNSGVYYISGNVNVNAGATLTINPGVVVQFGNGASLTVNGTLIAQGTSASPIIFTSATGATPGSWNYVQVNSGNSIFKYCTFEYGTCPLNLNYASSGSPVVIENCLFQYNSSYGLRLRNSKAKIKSCEMKNNQYGVYCYSNLDVKLIGNSIHHNTSGGVYSYSSNLLELYGNVIESNTGSGLVSYNTDIVRLGVPYSWEGYNTIRGNSGSEVSAYSGSPSLTMVTASIHDTTGLDINNTTSNQINTVHCYWGINNRNLFSGSIALNDPQYSIPAWDGQTRIAGSPLGKDAGMAITDSIPWILDPRIPGTEKSKRCKELIAKNTLSGDATIALGWLYSILREDYNDNLLGEKTTFFSYLQKLRSTNAFSALGKLALRYMIIWKMLENNNTAVVKLSQEALKNFTGEDKKWVLADLVHAYLNGAQIQEAKSIVQELRTKFSVDKDLIAVINDDITDVEGQIAKGLFKPNKEDKYSESELSIPTELELSQNYPNPFNPTTLISYQLPAASHISLKVFDMLGREVAELVNGVKEAGYHTASFDGSHLTSGVYFTRLVVNPEDGTASLTKTLKMLMVK
jgi:hypothetical protein